MKTKNTIAKLCELVGLGASVLAVPFVILCARCETVSVGAFLLAVAAVACLGALALQLERPGLSLPKDTDARKEPQLR